MGRLIYTAALVAVGAAVVHFAIVFLLPTTSPNSAGRQLLEAITEPITTATNLSALEKDGFVNLGLDPAFRVLACRYDVTETPFRMMASGRVPLWTISVLDSAGVSVFSANDRISPSDGVDVAVLNPTQLRTFRQTPDPSLDRSIIVAPGDSTGFVIVRVFEPDGSWASIVDDFATNTTCRPFTLSTGAQAS
ncbi:MAG: hypothetical protein AAGG69_02240 [Pseudomonadota bacterium]